MTDEEINGINRRRFIYSTGLLGASGLLAGCGGTGSDQTATPTSGEGTTAAPTTTAGKQPKGGTFVNTTSEGANTLDPRMEQLAWVDSLLAYIYDGLLIQKPDGSEIVNHLAKSRNRVDDTTRQFTLREGVKFHDGTELTAEDVAYTYNWILNPDNKSSKLANLSFLEGVETKGKYTVQFNLKNPFALFDLTMMMPIVPKKKAKEMGTKKFGKNPIGTGPFKLAEWEQASHITLERFDDYWLQTPNLDKVKWRVIPKKQVQYVELVTGGVHQSTVPTQLLAKAKKQENVEMKLFPHFDYNGLIFNALREPFSNRKVREAMQYLVDYDALLKATKGKLGKRSYGFMPKSVNKAWDFPWKQWRDTYYPKKDKAKAKQLLEEAGYGDGFGRKLQITSLSFKKFRAMAIKLQSALDSIGIKSEITEMTIGQWLTNLDKGKYDVNIYGWSGGQDPDGFYYFLFRNPVNDEGEVGKNYVGSASAGMLYQANPDDEELKHADKIIRKARTMTERSKRKPLYEEAAKIFQSRYPHIPVYSEQAASAWRTSVQDYNPKAFSSQPLCNEWHNSWIKQ